MNEQRTLSADEAAAVEQAQYSLRGAVQRGQGAAGEAREAGPRSLQNFWSTKREKGITQAGTCQIMPVT